MLRPVVIFALVSLALPCGCKEKQPPAAKPSPLADQSAPRMSPEMTEAQLDKLDEALKAAGISEERAGQLRSEIARQAPRFDFELSDDKQFVLGLPGAGPEGMPVTTVIVEIQNTQPVPESPADAVKQYFERTQQAVAEQRKKEQELLAKLERVDKGEIPDLLAPAADPIGDWRSLGETREGEKHFLVEHDDAYYKIMMINEKDKRMTYNEFREGKLERNVVQAYKYNPENGQLIAESPEGGPPDAYYLMQLPDMPNRMFVRPVYETVFMFTVYQRVGEADRVIEQEARGAPPVPPKGD